MTPALTWVVGRGGLLGRAVEAAVATTGPVWVPRHRVPWGETGAAAVLRASAEGFAAEAAGGPWQLAWCAGAGVTSSTPAELAVELDLLRSTVDALGSVGLSDGAVFLAGSAGGVYAGSTRPSPFTEASAPRPLSPYGEAKLEAERIVTAWAQRSGTRVVVGRIANLYGPGQNLRKPQGLISQFCRAHLTGQPLSLYVPLDTVRDYLYVGDAAGLVTRLLATSRTTPPATVVTKILASHRAVTVGQVLGEMRRILRRAPPVVLGASPAARHQALDLRLASVVWPDLDHRTLTPLPVGINATMEDLRTALRGGYL